MIEPTEGEKLALISRAFATLAKAVLPAGHKFVVLIHDPTRDPPDNTSMISSFTEAQLASLFADVSGQLNHGLKPVETISQGKPN